jgi:hypothetical protein
MYVLVGSSEHPVEYFSGGIHLSDGERIPNTVCSVEFAKKYEKENSAQKQADRLNTKYSWHQIFTVYKIGDTIASRHGTSIIQ